MPYRPLPIDQSDVRYLHGPDSAPQPGVPAGETVEFEWRGSEVYPGTVRKFWVHVPAQYDPAESASLMVFQDGWWYLDPAGEVRGAIVLDNLVHRGDIPVTIGVFVDPGVFTDAENPKNRNNEYDAFDDRYVTFLLTEIIPQVEERYTIAESPERWGICGGSSGGNCAFTAAWLRPDKFRRVIGYLSSFAQMPDGNPYPDLISRVPRKPLRIFMQAGHRDLQLERARVELARRKPARGSRSRRSGLRLPTGPRRRRTQPQPRRRPAAGRAALAVAAQRRLIDTCSSGCSPPHRSRRQRTLA